MVLVSITQEAEVEGALILDQEAMEAAETAEEEISSPATTGLPIEVVAVAVAGSEAAPVHKVGLELLYFKCPLLLLRLSM
jgi:hypothetical protein